MPKTKEPGYWERSKRRAAKATTGVSGIASTQRRGLAMLSALLKEPFETKKAPKPAAIRKEHTAKMAAKKAKKKAAPKKRRETAERSLFGMEWGKRLPSGKPDGK